MFGLDLMTIPRVDEAHVQEHPIDCVAQPSFQNVGDSELAADFAQLAARRVPVGCRGGTADHFQLLILARLVIKSS